MIELRTTPCRYAVAFWDLDCACACVIFLEESEKGGNDPASIIADDDDDATDVENGNGDTVGPLCTCDCGGLSPCFSLLPFKTSSSLQNEKAKKRMAIGTWTYTAHNRYNIAHMQGSIFFWASVG